MLKSKPFLAVDFGAGSLKLAEFELNEAGGLRLKQYGFKSLGAEGSQEATREALILKALQEMLAEKGIKSNNVNVCAPGFHVFSKFVKLPPVDANKITQIIQYEAQQNVPFPLEEVVWDYQILGSTPAGEYEVLLVAIKADIVEGLFRVTEKAGLKLQLADVSPAALCNAFRYNYGDLEDCTMLLDIGAKTSNLLFFEKGKVFSRSINLGANSITQDFANESKKKFDVAEKVKIEEGFVSLGGAYEEPENQDQAAISKIARQFMTRLHIQVNQTMQFYRGQQGGSAPQRLFLSGGAAIMPYTAQFFAEKLNVPVEYFNPLRNVQIDPAVNLEELARVAHSLGEVVGLGLRNLARCPVELNLMPESTLKWQSFNKKKPYLIATVFSLVLVVAAVGWLFDQLAKTKTKALEEIKKEIAPASRRSGNFKTAMKGLTTTTTRADQVAALMKNRYYWVDAMTDLRQVLMRVEAETKSKLHTDTGIWIEKFQTEGAVSQGGGPTTTPGGRPTSSTPAPPRRTTPAASPGAALPAPWWVTAPPASAEPAPAQPAPAQPAPAPAPGQVALAQPSFVSSVGFVSIVFRAVRLDAVSPSANSELAFTVVNALKNDPLFDPAGILPGTVALDPAQTNTFTFELTATLKRQLKL